MLHAGAMAVDGADFGDGAGITEADVLSLELPLQVRDPALEVFSFFQSDGLGLASQGLASQGLSVCGRWLRS